MERKISKHWRVYYNPCTFESGLEFVPDLSVFGPPVKIGAMPIRIDVPVRPEDVVTVEWVVPGPIEFVMIGFQFEVGE